MRSARAHLPKPRNTIRAATCGLSTARRRTCPGVGSTLSRDRGLPPSGTSVCRAAGLSQLREVRVRVGVGRCAAAEDAELARAGVDEAVPRTRRDQHRVAGADRLRLAVDLELAGSLHNDVDLLAQAVVVPLRRLVRLERRLGEALR